MRYVMGAFIASLLLIALHLKGEWLLGLILSRGNNTVWPDRCKQPTYRQMGRIYTTDMDGCGVRLEPVGVDVDGLVAGGRKVFTTKGATSD